MKVLVGLLILITLSCSNQHTGTTDFKNNFQTWKLVKMTGSLQNSEATGNEMAWQETIQLANGSFEKIRIENGSSAKISGRYEFSEEADGRYLILTYSSSSELIGNCTGDLKEYYRLLSEEKLQGTWLACDGPGLEYQLIN